MRLYRMELYKLCHKKSFLAGLLFVLLTGFFFFCQDLQYEGCVIDGISYTGTDAVRKNRQAAEEFKGVLTDDKVSRILEKYGFPREPLDEYNRLEGNFLNTFLMEYASDGYNNGQDDYRLATRAIPLAETELGQYYAAAGMEYRLEYYAGWDSFQNTLGILMLGASMLILYSVSGVFAEEEQSGMKPLLFTTKEGLAADPLAKIAAAFTVSVAVWSVSAAFGLLLHGLVYGTDGLGCISALIVHWGFRSNPLMMQPIGAYLAQVLLISLLGILELCAVTVCVSAHCRGCFHAIVASAICYTLPFLEFTFLNLLLVSLTVLSRKYTLYPGFLTACTWFCFLLGCQIYSTPVYLLVCRDILIEITRVNFGSLNSGSGMAAVYTALAIAALLLLLCTVNACRRYRKIPTV